MTESKEQLSVPALADYPQPIAAALWRMQDSRERTLNDLKELPAAAVDWQAEGLHNSIGTLLYHIAAIEMDWLFEEVLQEGWAADTQALFPYPVRDKAGHLYRVQQVSLSDHVARLETTRQTLLERFKGMTVEDFHRLREMPHYDVSPEWTLHHLAQHEDEHRGELRTIITLYEASSGKK